MSYETLLLTIGNHIATICFNRPEVHNCMSALFIDEMISAINEVKKDQSVRTLVIQAKGKSFSAGADLNDMQKMVDYTMAENIKESTRISDLMQAIKNYEKPTVALVQGPVYGGGCGIVACCDIVLATSNATFCFSEVKLGLIPAVISPYVIAKINETAARRYFLTAELIDANEAMRIGLITKVVPQDELHSEGAMMINRLINNSPHAVTQAKTLIDTIINSDDQQSIVDYTIKAISEIRVSTEGQEGLKAFFEKRKPNWII